MTIPAEQEEVAQFLSAQAGGSPRETHISAVFISPDTVWKLKKSIKMPFLDFRTHASRAHFLRRELELNSPTLPVSTATLSAFSGNPTAPSPSARRIRSTTSCAWPASPTRIFSTSSPPTTA